MTWIFSLLACPIDIEFGSLHNLMIQFLKTNLSSYSSLWPIDSVFWRIMTNTLGNPSLIKSFLSVNYLKLKLLYNCHCAFFFLSWLDTANPMLLQNLLTCIYDCKMREVYGNRVGMTSSSMWRYFTSFFFVYPWLCHSSPLVILFWDKVGKYRQQETKVII